ATGKRLGGNHESRTGWRDLISRLAAGGGGGIWLRRARSARSRYHLRWKADALRSPHPSSPEHFAEAVSVRRIPDGADAAGSFFAGRSAPAFLRRQHTLANERWRTTLDADQP